MRIFVAILFFAATVIAQTRVPTVTRTVQMFGDLERKLLDNAGSRDALIAADFEERLCAAPGIPVSRADWAKERTPAHAKLSEEAVHSYGDVAIYSASLSHGKSNYSIVDVWNNSQTGWRLAVRYRCPATGSKPEPPSTPKKY